ncbi:MAG: iron-containing alcohol dehydrogenase [Clostridiales bacterium]|nr:iron-containing alcohol dehydrogenase [Clostridiales bacterium]
MVTTYQQLCPVMFGVGAIEMLGERAAAMNAKHVFCVCDTGVRMTGLIDRICKILEQEKIEVTVFDEVLPDAPNDVVERAGELANLAEADMVLGVGGGSSLDTAKAVSVLCDNPAPISDYYLSNNGTFQIRTPLVLIPTASGTGSEVTIMSVIHDGASDAKEVVMRHADLAIVDPELTATAPPAVTAATALDAMSHAVEAYTSSGHSPNSDMQALTAIRLIARNLETAYRDGDNMEARTNLSFASNLAGMAFNDASVHFGHAAAHELGIRFHMPHGVACALTLPVVICFAKGVMPERVVQIAKALGMSQTEESDTQKACQFAVREVTRLMRAVGIRSMRGQGITLEQAVSCAKGAVEKNGFIAYSPKPVTTETMKDLLEQMYRIYQ